MYLPSPLLTVYFFGEFFYFLPIWNISNQIWNNNSFSFFCYVFFNWFISICKFSKSTSMNRGTIPFFIKGTIVDGKVTIGVRNSSPLSLASQ